MALEERRHILKQLIPDGGRIQFSQTLKGEATEIFAQVEKADLEGIVLKGLSSRYQSGETMEWRKATSTTEDEFEVLARLTALRPHRQR